jgi:hypothetical protein
MSRTALLVTVVLVAALGLGAVTLGRASDDVYGIPGWGVAATLVLVALAVAGCALIARARQPAFSAAILVGTALAVLGMLAILSFGLLALVVAALVLAWAGTRQHRSGRAAAGAMLAGAALPVLFVFVLSGPLVDCDPDGVTSGENLFMAGTSGSGASTGWGDEEETFTGTQRGDDYDYSYTCRGGELVSFELRRR